MQANVQQLRARPALRGQGAVLTARTPKCVAIQQPIRSRQHVVAAAVPEDDSTKAQQQDGDDINSRILSGEFTDSGSTKEKLTRPIRKALAQDPVGIGECKLRTGTATGVTVIVAVCCCCSSSCCCSAAAANISGWCWVLFTGVWGHDTRTGSSMYVSQSVQQRTLL